MFTSHPGVLGPWSSSNLGAGMRAWRGARVAPLRLCTTPTHHHTHATQLTSRVSIAPLHAAAADAESAPGSQQAAAGHSHGPRTYCILEVKRKGVRPQTDSSRQQAVADDTRLRVTVDPRDHNNGEDTAKAGRSHTGQAERRASKDQHRGHDLAGSAHTWLAPAAGGRAAGRQGGRGGRGRGWSSDSTRDASMDNMDSVSRSYGRGRSSPWSGPSSSRPVRKEYSLHEELVTSPPVTAHAAETPRDSQQAVGGRTRAPRRYGILEGVHEGGRPRRDSSQQQQQQHSGGPGTGLRDPPGQHAPAGTDPHAGSGQDTGHTSRTGLTGRSWDGRPPAGRASRPPVTASPAAGTGLYDQHMQQQSSTAVRHAPNVGRGAEGASASIMQDSRTRPADSHSGPAVSQLDDGAAKWGGPVPEGYQGYGRMQDLQALEVMVSGFEMTPDWQTPLHITQGMRKVVTHMVSRPDYCKADGFNNDERQLVDRLAVMTLSLASTMESILDPITALYACARGRYWHPQLLSAMMELLEADGCAMLKEQANGRSCANLGFIVKQAAEDAVIDKGNVAAHGLVQRAVKAGGVLHTACSMIVDSQQLARSGKDICLDPQGMSSLLLACVGIPYTSNTQLLDALLAGLAEQCRHAPRNPRSQHVANALYAIGVLASDHGYVPDAAALDTVVQHGADMIRTPGSTVLGMHMSMAVYGLAQCRHYHPAYLLAVEEALLRPALPTGLGAQQSSNLLWGMAMVGHAPRDAVIQRLLNILVRGQAAPQALASSLWAITVTGLSLDRRHTAVTVLNAVHQMPERAFLPRHKCLLWQVHEAAQRLGLPQLQLTGRLLERARKASEAEMIGSYAQLQANSEQQLHAALQRIASACSAAQPLQLAGGVQLLGLRVLPEEACMLRHSPQPVRQPQPDAYYMALDAVVEVTYSVQGGHAQQVQVAVMADGPFHFCSNQPYKQRLAGPTRLRNERLRHAFNGMLITVPYYEWDLSLKAVHVEVLLQRLALLLG